MHTNWLDPRGSLLTACCPLPLDRPFTAQQAHDCGVSRQTLRTLASKGLVRRVLREVYAVAQAPNDVTMRARALALVIPETAVVTDRTAAWLHGVDILPRTARQTPPPIEVVHIDDTRLRRVGVDGRRRGLTRTDITRVGGVPVTTALRTALDLGRQLWRYDALAAIDGFLRIGVPHELMSAEIGRFRGYRGVRQLRALVPLGNPLAESPGESGLRLHWHDAGLPPPVLQHWVEDDSGRPLFRLDLTDPDVRYAAEYDGEEFHTSPEQVRHDAERREWLLERGWHVDAFTKLHVYGRGPVHHPVPLLTAGHTAARRGLARWSLPAL